jgi:hypothetical protein
MRFLRRLRRETGDSRKQIGVETNCIAYQPSATAAMWGTPKLATPSDAHGLAVDHRRRRFE